MLDKLFQNKALKKMMLNQFKSIVEQEGLKAIVIIIDENGNMKDPKLYKEDITVLKSDEYKQLVDAITKNLM